jgi:GT2 family glycosyltransferase
MSENISLKIGIVIVHYSNVKNTENCIEHVVKQRQINIHIVIINNSISDTLERIIEKYKNVKIIRTTNKGFSSANNIGLDYLREHNIDIVWFLNNDAFPKSDAGYELAKHYTDKYIWLGGSLLYSDKELTTIQAQSGIWNIYTFNGNEIPNIDNRKNSITTLVYPIGASFMINKLALDKIGWALDESYFLYFEELDLVCTLKKHGEIKITFSPESKVYHIGGASAGSGSQHDKKSKLAKLHFDKSKRIFYDKHFPILYILLIIIERIRSAKNIFFA